MTVIYTSVNQRFNKILFRGYKDGKRIQSSDAKYAPVLYVPQVEESSIKTIYGENLREAPQESISAAKSYVKDYGELMRVHGNTKYEFDFIHRNFPGELSVTIDQLTILSLDIETSAFSFPDYKNPVEEVLLITCQDLKTKKLITFGSRPSTVDNYVLCSSEEDLLQKFIQYVIETDPDIFTGWNVAYFDFAYLGKRIEKLLGLNALKRLSPFNIVEEKNSEINGREQLKYEIVGRSVLDLLELYKKFRLVPRPSFKLDYIAEVEIGSKKLENPYATFNEFFQKDWNLFVQYNQRDVTLVSDLEAKLGLVYLATTLAYLCKVNYNSVMSPVACWENYIFSTLMEDNIFVAVKGRSHKSSDESIDGGYVKDPILGMYNWMVSLDAASMYPSIIMALNMSPETLVDMIPDMGVEHCLSGNISYDPRYSTAVNGSRYTKDKLGVLAKLTKVVFNKRKEAKNKMLDAKRQYEATHDISFKAAADRYNVVQLAVKTLGNCLFGSCANEHFVFFDNRIAEGITQTGQFTVRQLGADLNVYLNKLLSTDKTDYIVYTDTDSVVVSLGALVEKHFSSVKDEQKIADAIDKFVKLKLDPVCDTSMKGISNQLNLYEDTLYFKREAITSRGFFRGKKRYAWRVLDNEGVRYSEPDYKVVGIETNRSSTPDIVRGWLMEAITLILNTNNRDLTVAYIEEKRGEFNSYPIEQIAFPRSANNLQKYSDSTKIYTGGCPIAVRASLLFNHYIAQKNLKDKYELIKESDKIKFIYLKEPNTIKEDIIAFSTILPPELGLAKYIDYDTQFEKVFLDPLKNIMIAIGWKMEDENSLDSFF